MHPCPTKLVAWLAPLALTTMLLSGCGPALVTEAIGSSESGAKGCTAGAGGYRLPKDLIRLSIRKNEGEPNYYELSPPEIVRGVDGKGETYCLDFVRSAFTRDRISVSYATDKGGSPLPLLQAIKTEFKDESLKVAEAAVKAGAVLALQRGDFAKKREDGSYEYILPPIDFDPFDFASISAANNALRNRDHCVYLDPSDDAYVPDWHANLCDEADSNYTDKDYHGLKIIKDTPPPRALSARGILYRPLLTHTLVVMKRNRQPTGRRWEVFERKKVQLTNAAPAFLLEINRSLFVERDMDIEFEKGVLVSVNITKPSEAEALSKTVLKATQIIVSIPVRALIFRRSEAQNRQALIAAQGELIAAMRAYDIEVEKERQKRIAEAATAANGGAPLAGAGQASVQGECSNWSPDQREVCEDMAAQ